ncbi:MAG: UDP-3-O-(3-hydroxymyristoyl)glucosamine N-acyltransferase [Planctomycetes bacterium]|nr:UDP-3-O-(3-hydroxymyristoyl)glucosamine N-acyltransferase [Planctomycetota bacterium]
MTVTVQQLADLVQGNLFGDRDVAIHSACGLEEAQVGDITLLADPQNVSRLQESKAVAAVVPVLLPTCGKALIQVADPLFAFAAIVQHLRGIKPPPPEGIDARAVIAPSAQVGERASIQPFVLIGENTVIGKRCRLAPGVRIGANCRLGDDVVIHANAVIQADTLIGDRVIVHANTVIGADGFGYRFTRGQQRKIPQLGTVVLGDDVEIGAGTKIDRGTFGPTTIAAGTKIGSLVQIAHNCQIGEHNLLAAQVGIAGSCATGENAVMGGQAGVKDHIQIGAGAVLEPGSGVIENIPARSRVSLYPSRDHADADEIVAGLKELPQMRRNLRRALKRLKGEFAIPAEACEA